MRTKREQFRMAGWEEIILGNMHPSGVSLSVPISPPPSRTWGRNLGKYGVTRPRRSYSKKLMAVGKSWGISAASPDCRFPDQRLSAGKHPLSSDRIGPRQSQRQKPPWRDTLTLSDYPSTLQSSKAYTKPPPPSSCQQVHVFKTWHSISKKENKRLTGTLNAKMDQEEV